MLIRKKKNKKTVNDKNNPNVNVNLYSLTHYRTVYLMRSVRRIGLLLKP